MIILILLYLLLFYYILTQFSFTQYFICDMYFTLNVSLFHYLYILSVVAECGECPRVIVKQSLISFLCYWSAHRGPRALWAISLCHLWYTRVVSLFPDNKYGISFDESGTQIQESECHNTGCEQQTFRFVGHEIAGEGACGQWGRHTSKLLSYRRTD